MKYRTGYYWQTEEVPHTALVLQHLVYRKRKKPLFWGCICTEGHCGGTESWRSAYYVRQLTEWFHRKGRRWCLGEKTGDFDRLRVTLAEAIAGMDAEVAAHDCFLGEKGQGEVELAGLVCGGECFLLFYRGNIRVYLLNRRLSKGHCMRLQGEKLGTMHVLSGIMQPGIGLLLITEEMAEKCGEERLQECLNISELLQAHRPQRYLEELGREAAKQEGSHMGALLLLTDEWKEE